MNKETKTKIIVVIIKLILLIIQVSIFINSSNIDNKSYAIGVIMASITFLLIMTKSIIKKIMRWLDE